MLLAAGGLNELKYIDEVISKLADSMVILPWMQDGIKGLEQLQCLSKIEMPQSLKQA